MILNKKKLLLVMQIAFIGFGLSSCGGGKKGGMLAQPPAVGATGMNIADIWRMDDSGELAKYHQKKQKRTRRGRGSKGGNKVNDNTPQLNHVAAPLTYIDNKEEE